jgi:ribosomal protein S28E/S33
MDEWDELGILQEWDVMHALEPRDVSCPVEVLDVLLVSGSIRESRSKGEIHAVVA